MKKYIQIIGLALCLSLTLFGCGESTAATGSSTPAVSETVETEITNAGPSTAPEVVENPDSTFLEQGIQTNDDAFQYHAEHLDDEELAELEQAMADGTLTEEQRALAIAAGYLSEAEEVGENADDHADIAGYPSTEEILACIDSGESKLYWCAETPDYSGTMDIQPVEIPDMGDFAANLSDILGDGYSISDSSTNTVTITPDGSEPDMETILSALSQLTGTEYAEIAPEEIYVAEYVPALNGYGVDAEGFFFGGERAGEGVMGSYVSVFENGEITVHTPLVLCSTATAIDTSALVAPEAVETICRAYYENLMEGRVTVITDVTLGYYYSEDDNSLRPAWQCDMTFYMSENGHNDSVLMDAQTGELLRK